jgi:RecB family exonuclease
MQLSYSKLKTFSDCALKYRYAYMERLPRPPVASLTSQRRLHAALAKYHFYARRDGAVRLDDLLAAYAEIAGANEDASVRDSRAYQEGADILRRYCERENGAERAPAFLEHKLRVEFGPYILTGTVDRLDFSPSGGYSLIDYKLDRKLPEENSAEQSQQLSFYDLLVFEGMGVAPDDVRLYYLRHGVEHVSSRSRAQRRETVEWVETLAARIREERAWQPREGEACRTCAFAAACPAKTGIARPPQPVWQQTSLLDLVAD